MKTPTPRVELRLLNSSCSSCPGTSGRLEVWCIHFQNQEIGHEFLAHPFWWV